MPAISPAVRVAAMRGALSMVNAGKDAHLDGEALDAILHGAAFDSAWAPHLKALFGNEDAAVLQDLVYAGVCSFSDLLRTSEAWHIERNLLSAWVESMATVEYKESKPDNSC